MMQTTVHGPTPIVVADRDRPAGFPARARRLSWWLAAAVAAIAIVSTGRLVSRYVHGFSLIVRGADRHGILRVVAELDTVRISERLVQARLPRTTIGARVYAPLAASRQTVLLVTGLHPGGIDEPRLVALARELAKADVTVVTPDLPELSRLEISATLTERIEQAAVWLAADSGLAPHGRIGLMGISFSGGLAIVAAGRPSLRHRLSYVFSFGGHDDLGRVLQYFCAGGDPPGCSTSGGQDGSTTVGAPHDYGLAVVLLNVADRVVPAEQLTPFRNAVRRFLWASYLDRVDKPQAAVEFAAVRALTGTLPEPASTLLDSMNRRDVVRLGAALRPHVISYLTDPALSPARSPLPSAPVFLLHGSADNVIPAVESQSLAARLEGHVPVHLLLTDLMTHAAVDRPAHVVDVLQLAGFWGDLLRQ